MNKSFQLCDLCCKLIKYARETESFTLKCSFSNAWHLREYETGVTYNELCYECLEFATKKVKQAWNEVLKERKEINKPEIILCERDREQHNSSGMRDEKPSSRRHKKPLLQFLPSFLR